MAKNGQKNQKGPKGGQEPQKYELSFYYKQQETPAPRPNHIRWQILFLQIYFNSFSALENLTSGYVFIREFTLNN